MRVNDYECDGCGKREPSRRGNKPPKGWLLKRHVPGMLRNTERRLDEHYCSTDCATKNGGMRKSEPLPGNEDCPDCAGTLINTDGWRPDDPRGNPL